MPTLTLTDDQVVELVQQLPTDRKYALSDRLLDEEWPEWAELSRYGEERARATAAARGRDWDTMTEAAREAFIDDLLHE